MTRIAARASLAVLALLATGCATQANMVDLERDVAVLKQRLGPDSSRFRVTAPDPGPSLVPVQSAPLDATPIGGGPNELFELTIALDEMRSEMAQMRGQVDELLYGMTTLTQEADQRLAALEEKAGITVVPTLPPPPTSGAAGEATVSEVVKPGIDGGVVMRGVVVPPREEDAPGGVSAGTAFELAANDLKRGHYSLAAAGFANFLTQYPDSALAPEATFWLGESYRGQGLAARAVKVWEMEVNTFPRHDMTPRALLALGEAYRGMDDIPAAEEALKRLVAGFPTSNYAGQAKLILSELR